MASALFVNVIPTTPVMWTPFVGAATATHGRTPLITWICAMPLTAPTDATTVPFAGGGLAVKLTFAPEVALREPTPPVTLHEYARLATGLFQRSRSEERRVGK